jgi:hypothetical protein
LKRFANKANLPLYAMGAQVAGQFDFSTVPKRLKISAPFSIV